MLEARASEVCSDAPSCRSLYVPWLQTLPCIWTVIALARNIRAFTHENSSSSFPFQSYLEMWPLNDVLLFQNYTPRVTTFNTSNSLP